MIKYYSSKDACYILGVCRKTLQNWAKAGKIDYILTKGGWRKYNIDSYLDKNDINKKVKVCYCRVSTYEQKNDLETQANYLKNKYPTHEIIKDIGSGINFKRKGLLKIIDLAIKNKLEELIITYKDRLCRIGYEMLEYIMVTYSKTNIVIENKDEITYEQKVTEDLIEIITVYSSKLYGHRSYKK